jgi:hypothetical protein
VKTVPPIKLSKETVLALRGRIIEDVIEHDGQLILLLAYKEGEDRNSIKVGLGRDPGLDNKGYPMAVVEFGGNSIWTT